MQEKHETIEKALQLILPVIVAYMNGAIKDGCPIITYREKSVKFSQIRDSACKMHEVQEESYLSLLGG